MSQNGLGVLNGAHLLGLVRHVLDEHGREVRTAAIFLWAVYESRATTSCSTIGAGAIYRAHWRFQALSFAGVELRKCIGQIVGMDELVRRVFEAHGPIMGRTGWRRNEEQLAGVGQRQVLMLAVRVCLLAEVDPAAVTDHRLAVPGLADGNGRFDVEEGYHDAAKRLEWRKGMNGGRPGDETAYPFQVVWSEDVEVVQSGEEEGVGGWCGLCQGRKTGEIQCQI